MKILVCGGRDYGWLGHTMAERVKFDTPRRRAEYQHVFNTLNKLSEDWPKTEPDDYGNSLPDVTIIQGGATGADSAARDWAVVNWTRQEEHKADWDKHGDAAGPIRNLKMLVEGKPDLVVAFPGGKGTRSTIRLARWSGVEVIEVEDISN